MVSLEQCRAMPKVELHVHLEGSIRPETVLELARRNSVSLPYDTVEGLKEWYQFKDFEHFVEIYVAVSKCIRTPEDVEFIAKEFLVGQHAQNIHHTDVTYTASTIAKYCGIPWDEQIDALERAMTWGNSELGVTMSLILDIVRGDSPEEGMKTAEMAVSGMNRGVGALGLAGVEGRNTAEPYTESYAFARSNGLPVIPHAGETQGAFSVREALDVISPTRIGHGVRCLEDPDLVKDLVEKGVVLEVCPSSNVCLGGVSRLEDHPLPILIASGLTVTINSDDPPMFNTTLSEEFARCSEVFGFSEGELKGFAKTAAEHCLVSENRRRELIALMS